VTSVLPTGLELPGLNRAWSRTVTAPDAEGVPRTWHVLDNGVQPTVGTLLCAHGNPTWSYLWRGLLAAAPSGWRVVAPDHLGMGFSERPDAPRTFAQRVDDLGRLTDALGITGPVVTVGHDWGGAISLGWALAHPDQLRGIVLGNTAVAQPPGDRGPSLIRLAHVPWIRENACVRTPGFVRATAALSRPALPDDVRRALAAPYRSAARRRAIGDFVADIPFAPAHRSRSTVEAIADGVRTLKVPALLLWGPRDPVFGEKYLADLRARLPHAQLHRYEGASHLVTEDAPQYADAIARWVSAEVSGKRRKAPAYPLLRATSTAPHRSADANGARLWSELEQRATHESAAVVEVGHRPVSWAALGGRVRELAAGMAVAGILPGQRIGMLVEPSADLTAVVYAAWRAGAVVVVADKGLGFAGMRRALRSASVDHVVGATAGLAAGRLMGVPGGRLAVGDPPLAVRRALGVHHTLDELAGLGRDALAGGGSMPAEPALDADCAVVFTSGATGPAKGVVYRHAQVQSQLALLRSTYRLTDDDRLVAAFAPFSLLGPALGIGSAVPAVDVTKPGTLTAVDLADAVAAIDATIVFASPAALRNVDATRDRLASGQATALQGVRLVMSAGAPVPLSMLESLRGLLPAASFHTPYGMTEALPIADVSLEEIREAGAGEGICVGRALDGVEIALSPLADDGSPDGSLTVEPCRTGEICVQAGHVKDRYDALWATDRATTLEPGWHRTGDVGHVDSSGRLWVEGRLVHVITTAAGPVTPVGVEQRVEQLPEVGAAAAVGIGPPGTQVVAVVVVPKGGGRTTSRRRLGVGRLRVADLALTEAVRTAAGTHVAAVLTAATLPVDIRHASKVDRQELAETAARLLAGSP
jgi:acyl-CoA synthetase (AMP-forming)/AMP-acid ligase II/pimeloyl-ACP methyl ester carboxylesterase